MLKLLKKKDGVVSLVEIVMTSIIFTISAVGVISAIAMLNRNTMPSAKKLNAVYIGKQFMEDLRTQIWNIAPGNYTNYIGNQTTGIYTIRWTVQYDATNPYAPRDLTMDISY